MGEIIQIKVEKGGVGKTFIASNLAHLLALLEYKVIILSIDWRKFGISSDSGVDPICL